MMFAKCSDRKLHRLAQAPIGLDRCQRELRVLGQTCDLITIPAGTVLHHEGRWVPWSYAILDGAALVSTDDEPIAVAGAGSWVLGSVPGRERHHIPRASVTAASALEALAFRPRDLELALNRLPDLANALR